jgi:methionyl-tRNA formyltransferase
MERIGVTVHSVDSGVDTGTVIAQTRVQPTPRDGFLCLPLLQYRAALPLLVDHLVSGTSSGALPGSSTSRQWYHPRLGQYLALVVSRRLPY